jgi:hypothetical protein
MAAAAMLAVSLIPEPAAAQGRRAVRAAPRRGAVAVAAYYRPLFYDPFFYDPWSPFRYGWYPPPYAYGPGFVERAAVRLQVSPRETEVFVDGYYAGTVDDYDGFFQRLRVEPGEHDLTLYLEGHRSVTQKILLQPGATFRVRHTMEPLAAGEAPPPRPAAAPGPPRQAAPRSGGAALPAPQAGFGAVAVRIQPADADVLVDGERWAGPASDETLVIQVAAGLHRIEVSKDGYGSYASDIDVRAGETTPLNVSLPRR